MKAKGMKKGGKVGKNNSGLYGRVQKKQAGGGVKGPGDPQQLSGAQQNLLRQAQQYAQQTGQNTPEVQRLTGIYGNQTGASNTPSPAPTPRRRPPTVSGPMPRRGGFGGRTFGGRTPSRPRTPPMEIPGGKVLMPPGRGTAGGPSAPGRRMPPLRPGIPGRRPPMTGGRTPPPPPRMGGRGRMIDTSGFLDFYDRQMPEPRLPGGGRLRPPVMGPMPDASRMMPRRMESISQTVRDALGMMPPRRRRPTTGGRTPPPVGRGRGRGRGRPSMSRGPRGRGGRMMMKGGGVVGGKKKK